MSESTRVRSAFGKEIDIPAVEGVAIQELLGIYRGLLEIENGDPNYEYGWLVANDPMTSVKVRKGLWEIVDANTDPVIAPGSIKEDGAVRVNELILVRMPKEKYKKLNDAAAAIALSREAHVASSYKQNVINVSKQISPDSTGEPVVTETKQVKVGRSWVKS